MAIKLSHRHIRHVLCEAVSRRVHSKNSPSEFIHGIAEIAEMIAGVKRFFAHKIVREGGPFFVFLLCGVVGLKQFTSIRYEFAQTGKAGREAIENAGIPIKKQSEVTLEKEYEKIKNVDINNWKNIRVPRPWNENEE